MGDRSHGEVQRQSSVERREAHMDQFLVQLSSSSPVTNAPLLHRGASLMAPKTRGSLISLLRA